MRLLVMLAWTTTMACGGGARGPGGGPPAGAGDLAPAGAPAAGAPSVEAPPADAAVILLPPGGGEVRIRVELARTEPARSRGLMHRRELAADAGMLFLFDRMEHQSFWMENTLIPLDMIFIDHARRVVGVVENAAPRTRDAREVEGESQYVLEVNGGLARRWGVGPGTEVRFENVPGMEDEGAIDEQAP